MADRILVRCVLDLVFAVAMIAALASGPILLVNWFRYWRSGRNGRLFPIKSVIVFIASVVLGLATTSTSTSIARMEVLGFLQRQSPDRTVAVNGHAVQNSKEILNALKEVRELPYHHSSPYQQIRVDISDHSHLVLLLARDSNNPREYWIFYPRHFVTRSNDIGHIISPLFDAY